MDVVRTRLIGLALLVPWTSVMARGAAAQPTKAKADVRVTGDADPTATSAPLRRMLPILGRPHTLAEVRAGFLALPQVPIAFGSREQSGAQGIGDATLMTGLNLLYRGGYQWTIGASARFSPIGSSNDAAGGQDGLVRNHSRSYLLMGPEVRYIPLHSRAFEGWVGATGGAVIVADRYTTEGGAPTPAIYGTRSSTVRTEGLTLGVQAGLGWNVAEQWALGLTANFDRWFLPGTRACLPIGDCATLRGGVESIGVGLSAGYRIPL